MKIIKELKEIAKFNEKRMELSKQLEESGFEYADFDLSCATLMSGCTEKNGCLYDKDGNRLDNAGLVDDLYYCYQLTGYLEDDYYGNLYYATDEQGVFVKITFTMY